MGTPVCEAALWAARKKGDCCQPPFGDYFLPLLPPFLMVSTTWVFGLLVACFTVVNRPDLALRPIFMVLLP